MKKFGGLRKKLYLCIKDAKPRKTITRLRLSERNVMLARTLPSASRLEDAVFKDKA